MTSRSIVQKHDATMGNYLWLVKFLLVYSGSAKLFPPGKMQTRPTIRLSLSREGSVITLQSASSPCNQPIALLSAPSPCHQSHCLAVSLVALQSAPSPCNQPRRLEICVPALQSTSLPCRLPHHFAVVYIVPNNAPYFVGSVKPLLYVLKHKQMTTRLQQKSGLRPQKMNKIQDLSILMQYMVLLT